MHNLRTTRERRARGARRLVVAAAVVATGLLLTACLSADQQTLVDQVNGTRKSNGKRALTVDYNAANKAQAWAEHMARTGVLEHTGGGTTVDPSGLTNWCSVSENVGKGPNLAGIHEAFLNSPSHKANILSNTHRIGTGVVKKGSYYWVTEIFIKSCS